MDRQEVQIKICGIVDPEDAVLAGSLGATKLGMILWKGSSKGVDLIQAKEIAAAARQTAAEPVGVFVEGDFDAIADAAQKIGLTTIQLHRYPAKGYLEELSRTFKCIYALSVKPDGMIDRNDLDNLKANEKHAHWILFDHMAGGTGMTFNWEAFVCPTSNPWFLAGGITPYNVKAAITMLNPGGIDVSSGVQKKGTTRKDRDLLLRLFEEVKR